MAMSGIKPQLAPDFPARMFCSSICAISKSMASFGITGKTGRFCLKINSGSSSGAIAVSSNASPPPCDLHGFGQGAVIVRARQLP